jgi:hypothetical protein
MANENESTLTTMAPGDYLLRPIEFIKKVDRCCLITEYPNGPRISDILKVRKECGQFIRVDSLPSFSQQDEPDESIMNGYLSDSEAQIVM